MAAQLPLFGQARNDDPGTAKQAARLQRGGAETVILNTAERLDTFTRSELCAAIGAEWHPPTISTALSRLERRGLVTRTGATRRGDRGALQDVYELESKESHEN
jgi:predicted transcriptional regulator